MNRKKFIKPPLDERFLHTNITSWEVRNKITYDHGKYCIRFTLTFNDKKENRQIGGFKTQAVANQAKTELITELANQTFIPYEFTVSEFLNYWLYYYMIDEKNISYQTFVSYRKCMERFLEYVGMNKKMNDLSIVDIIDAIKKYPTKHVRKIACSMIGSSFKYAVSHHIVRANYAKTAIEIAKKQLKENCTAPKRPVFTLPELLHIFDVCREVEPSIYLLMLLSAATGTRISETIGICFSDINFVKKEVSINHQLGRTFDNSGYDEEMLLSQKMSPKTENGCRTVPLPDFIIDELILQKARYDHDSVNDPEFLPNSDFVLTRGHGYPMTRAQGRKLKNVLKEAGMDPQKYTWHDIRHSYATLLNDQGLNLKTISKILGHGSSEITDAVYINHHEDKKSYDLSETMNMFYFENLCIQNSEVYNISNIRLILD